MRVTIPTTTVRAAEESPRRALARRARGAVGMRDLRKPPRVRNRSAGMHPTICAKGALRARRSAGGRTTRHQNGREEELAEDGRASSPVESSLSDGGAARGKASLRTGAQAPACEPCDKQIQRWFSGAFRP